MTKQFFIPAVAIFLFVTIFSALVDGKQGGCVDAPVSKNYTQALYTGFWYEIAKIQTRGGAFFERNCVCTSINVTYSNDGSGDALAIEECRNKSPSGSLTTVYGELVNNQGIPGRWIEIIQPNGVGSVNYTVVEIGNDYAVEYDCGVNDLGVVNYCLHYMSRSPTIDQSLLNQLVNETAYLNTQNLELTMTLQNGCWSDS